LIASSIVSLIVVSHFTSGKVKLITNFGKLVIDWSVHTVTCWWCRHW